MLETELIGRRLKNPTILASGILGMSSSSLINVINNGAGAVTTKSFSLKERKGHKNPILCEFDGGFINAVGLSNPGIEEMKKEINEFKKKCNAPLIASVFAERMNEFGEIVEKTSELKPDFIELNISCPNVDEEMGKPFACNKESAMQVTEIARERTKIPLIVKLSPNVDDITVIAKAAEEAGANAINAINTLGPGMVIDVKTGKPILANKFGGVSGKAVKPITVASVYKIYEKVNIPIIGTGGVAKGEDAVELLMAGASAVGIGTGVYYRGIDVFKKVCEEMKKFMKENGYRNIKELVGKAHE
ncbi:MAG: dihydroorotate dehydrogenase [archaeon]